MIKSTGVTPGSLRRWNANNLWFTDVCNRWSWFGAEVGQVGAGAGLVGAEVGLNLFGAGVGVGDYTSAMLGSVEQPARSLLGRNAVGASSSRALRQRRARCSGGSPVGAACVVQRRTALPVEDFLSIHLHAVQ